MPQSVFLKPQRIFDSNFGTRTQKNNSTCFGACLYSAGRKTRESFWENAGEWTGRVEISKKEIPGSKLACMAVYRPTSGFKGFKLCVLNRWNFNFCVRSSPLRGTTVSDKTKTSDGVPAELSRSRNSSVFLCEIPAGAL